MATYTAGQMVLAIVPANVLGIANYGLAGLPGLSANSIVVARVIRSITTATISGQTVQYDLFIPEVNQTYEEVHTMDGSVLSTNTRIIRSVSEDMIYTKAVDATTKLLSIMLESTLFTTYMNEVPQV